jgi:cyclophilin family peptidyl-prolyl cis-trans isomerase
MGRNSWRTLQAYGIEPLESRTMFNVTVTTQLPAVTAAPSGSASVDLDSYFNDPTVVGTAVEIQTSLGNIPLTLFNSQTPKTVANFENYITTPGEYSGTIVHRSIPGFIIQGGGFTTDGNAIPTPFPSPTNEPGISNTTGTIAMAKQSNLPNSATDQWFINLADNSSNLDQQNGGFTVFGQVIYNGMPVVNAIAALPTVDDSQNPPGPDIAGEPDIWSNLPVNNYTGSSPTTTFVPPANMVTTNIVDVPALTYTVTSDNTSVVNPTVSGNTLQLNYGSDGTANVTVTAQDLGFNVVSSTFAVDVGGVAVTQATVGKGAAHVIHFTDPNGVAGTATLAGPGTATLTFTGAGVSESTNKAGIETVTGTPQSLSISTAGTTAGSVLSIGGAVTVGGISTDGNIGSIAASRVSLSGNLTIAGTAGAINFASANGGTIAVNAGGRPFALTVGSASGESVSSAGTIGSITAGTWTAGGSLAAPTINRIAVKQEFNANISATTVGQVSAATVTASTWNVSGHLAGIAAGSIIGLTLSAGSIGAIADRGAAANDTINSGANITSVSALSMTGTRIYAGGPALDASQIPTVFPADDTISVVTVGKGGFSNSVIGGGTLSHVNLAAVTSSNGGTPFGLAADGIISLTAVVDGKRLTLARVTSATQVTAGLTKAGITPNDLVIRIV